MINYNKNKLINKTLDEYYGTFSHTLDTADFVPEKFNVKIGRYIFKNMKKAFRLIDREDRQYQRMLKKKMKLKKPKAKGRLWKLFHFKRKSKGQRKNADSNDNS